jgi:hypothetical protein
MTAAALLDRLDRVRERGNGQWYASCPTAAHKHGDRSRGLSVKETSDGTTLIHCFAGCPPADILTAIGMELTDLFPEKLEPRKGGQRQHHLSARDALQIIGHESMIVACAAASLLDGTAPADVADRVSEAVARIHTVIGETHVS